MYHILITKISNSFFLLLADKLQSDKEKLFQGGTNDDVKPRVRTPEEIMAAYRKTGVMLNSPFFLFSLFILYWFEWAKYINYCLISGCCFRCLSNKKQAYGEAGKIGGRYFSDIDISWNMPIFLAFMKKLSHLILQDNHEKHK